MKISVARIDHFDLLADRRLAQYVHDFAFPGYGMAVKAGNDIAADQSCFVRRSIRRRSGIEGHATFRSPKSVNTEIGTIRVYGKCGTGPPVCPAECTHQTAHREKRYQHNPDPGRATKTQAPPARAIAKVLLRHWP